MYDLPKKMSFEFLEGRELELICFGPYAVTLHFGDHIQIQIEGAFEHAGKHKADGELYSFPIHGSHLMRLLTQQVTAADAKRDGTLAIEFSNGDRLTIQGNVSPYESYNVRYPGGVVVV